ncbi:unnamed protein product, partial [Urochloa humidicola]
RGCYPIQWFRVHLRSDSFFSNPFPCLAPNSVCPGDHRATNNGSGLRLAAAEAPSPWPPQFPALPPKQPFLLCMSSSSIQEEEEALVSGRGNLLPCSSSGAPSTVVTKEQEVDSSSEEASSEPALLSYKDDPNFRGCRGCGWDELERGCNGEAYRPCPGFVASGGRYRRQGQSMDDVASGRGKSLQPKPKVTNKQSGSGPKNCSLDNGRTSMLFMVAKKFWLPASALVDVSN